MKKIILLGLSIVGIFAFSTLVSAADAYPKNIDINNYHIEWSDEFDGTALNSLYWECQTGDGSQYGIKGWGNNEQEWYMRKNASVANGMLSINAKYEENINHTGYNFTSARINTSGKVHVGLGYVEARIQIPSAKGIWPAFWMLGTNGKTWPACGEIDIMEAFNTRPTLQSTIHWPAQDGKDKFIYGQKNLDDKTQWHTYGVYRDGQTITFYIDRVAYCSWSTADGTYGTRSVLNDDNYILLNVACGGNLAGGLPNSDLDVNMNVDYVRYYKDGPEPTVATTAKETPKPTTAPAKPGRVKIKSVKNIKKRKLKVTLKKIKGVNGYKVRYCENKKFDGYEDKSSSKTKIVIKGLEKKTTYFIKARAYKKSGGGKIYGNWSKVSKKKVKK